MRTLELGEYFGIFEGERLVAMVGERFQAGPFRELRRGETPFLHVMHDKLLARGLYERMGFVYYRESAARSLAL